MNTPQSPYNKFVEIMANETLSKLNGTHPNFKRIKLPDKPSKIIIVGTLGDKSKDYSLGISNEARTLTSVKNNSLSIKFLVDKSIGNITIKPSLFLYYSVYPTFEEEKKFVNKNYENVPEKVEIARVWKRYDHQFEPIRVEISKEHSEHILNFEPVIKNIKNDTELYRAGKEIDSKFLENPAIYEKRIKEINVGTPPNLDWKGKILVDTEDFIQNGEKLKMVTITMVNETEKNQRYETFFFNCNLLVDLRAIELKPFKYEYNYEGRTKYYESYLRCLNCHAEYDRRNNRVTTKHFAKFEQKKLIPRETINSLSLSFEDLMSREKNLPLLEKLYISMENFLNSYKNSPRYSSDTEYKEKTDKFEKIMERFQEGLNTLKNDENARKAFELLNETFKQASRFIRWRIFQLVFIVSLIPDIVNKTKRRDICEVLHVHTGGGKTEAYLGCIIFSAFYERLTGKRFGTVAIVKFPLRMLSIQQLQRIASLFIWAEEIRKRHGIEGKPFSVAYFVGSTDEFPRYTSLIIQKLQKAKKEGKETKGKIIENCPICGGKVILDFENKRRYIIHRCKACNREFRLFYTDEEIYRFLPTLIVSTVDKFAGIALNRRFRNIFGGKIDECPEGHGFIPHNDECEVEMDNHKKCKKRGGLCDMNLRIAPILIIQDEMHLIREAFGTINSHFESFIDILQEEFCGYKPKRIAMTATVSSAKEQIAQLYHKKINVFPGESPDGLGNNDFFFEYIFSNEEKIDTQRILIGLKPNLRDNQFASLLTLKYLSEFIKNAETNATVFCEKLGIDTGELQKLIENYKVFLTYHNKKSDVHSMNYYLEHVVNSKLDDYKIKPKILTGDNTLEDIKELIDLVGKFFKVPENKRKLLTIFATSIVSHGIDIEKWNAMIFQGFPRSTAEYIQALSRVGRKYPGLVFVWFYPNRARDLSYYQNFIDYHRILDHKVEIVPISRWAKLGFKQTFTSIFSASILNYMSNIIDEPVYSVDKVNEVFSKKENREKLIEFIKKAYISNSKMIGAEYFKGEIPGETEERLSKLAKYTGGEKHFFPNALKDCDNKYYRTQYGMRGIQDVVVLHPENDIITFVEKALEE